MNAINKAAPAPLFMLALFGTGAVGIALSALAVGHPDQRWAVFTSPTTMLSPLEWERGVAPGFPAAELGAQARYCCLSAI